MEARPGHHLHGVPLSGEEFDQVPRKLAFKKAHPEVYIGLVASGTWQARIPEETGETIYTRWELKDLLDKLEEVFGP